MYIYIYNDFDTTSIYLIIKRQGYFISFSSQGRTEKKNANCCIISYLIMTIIQKKRKIDKSCFLHK